MPRRPWAPAEDAYLEDRFGHATLTEIAGVLGRSLSGTWNRAKLLGLFEAEEPDRWTSADAGLVATRARAVREDHLGRDAPVGSEVPRGRGWLREWLRVSEIPPPHGPPEEIPLAVVVRGYVREHKARRRGARRCERSCG